MLQRLKQFLQLRVIVIQVTKEIEHLVGLLEGQTLSPEFLVVVRTGNNLLFETGLGSSEIFQLELAES